jgi:hypothetical protein
VWTGFNLELGSVASSCQRTDPSGFIKGEGFLDYLCQVSAIQKKALLQRVR